MDEMPDCVAVSPLLAELAAGAATGYERAQALRHVDGCLACRRELAELARVLGMAKKSPRKAGLVSAVSEDASSEPGA